MLINVLINAPPRRQLAIFRMSYLRRHPNAKEEEVSEKFDEIYNPKPNTGALYRAQILQVRTRFAPPCLRHGARHPSPDP